MSDELLNRKERKEEIVTCVSCDGYGWLDEDGAAETCAWCAGVGYVYRDAAGVVRPIPPTDFDAVAERLEALEAERLQRLGYTGAAKKPWEQDVRRGARGGVRENSRPHS